MDAQRQSLFKELQSLKTLKYFQSQTSLSKPIETNSTLQSQTQSNQIVCEYETRLYALERNYKGLRERLNSHLHARIQFLAVCHSQTQSITNQLTLINTKADKLSINCRRSEINQSRQLTPSQIVNNRAYSLLDAAPCLPKSGFISSSAVSDIQCEIQSLSLHLPNLRRTHQRLYNSIARTCAACSSIQEACRQQDNKLRIKEVQLRKVQTANLLLHQELQNQRSILYSLQHVQLPHLRLRWHAQNLRSIKLEQRVIGMEHDIGLMKEWLRVVKVQNQWMQWRSKLKLDQEVGTKTINRLGPSSL